MTSPPPDTTPPSAVGTLVVGSPTPTSLTVTWTAVGDDGGSGTATTYDLRYSTSAITAGNFASATVVTGEPAPHVAGTAESMTVSGLSSSTTYYFALKVADEVPNWSLISNLPSETTEVTPPPPPPPVSPPVAGFAGTPPMGEAPLPVSFTDQSTNSPTSWAWSFGDGGTSTVPNPSHTYAAAGAYTVTLTATNARGSDPETKADYITVTAAPPPAPTAAFTGTPTSGTAFVHVTFTDQSTNSPTSWAWSFGDGGVSTARNPSHTYATVGSYSVTLTAANAGGSDVETKQNYITVFAAPPPAPDAAFAASAVSGVAPLPVSFTDQSTNSPTNWAWSFGDGGTSTVRNPSHTYAAPGSYTVTLTAANSGGFDAETKTNYIMVSAPPPPPPVAAFNGVPTSGSAPLTVAFTDESANQPTSWVWNFGDDGTSTEQDPNHTYSTAGAYSVTLTTTNAGGSHTVTYHGYITVTALPPPPPPPPPPVADFTGQMRAGAAPLTVIFADRSTNSPTSWAWSFGDGGTATTQNPSHTYLAAGNFTVSLTAGNAGGTNTKTSVEYVTVSAPPPLPDTTPPADITTLAVGSSTQAAATLTWTAVGDDGDSGVAESYDLRYSTSNITPGNFSTATAVVGEGAPVPPGQVDTFTVTGLAAGTAYYFAIKVSDEVGNWSGLSNVARGATEPAADVESPATVPDLATISTTSATATLSWTSAGDDGDSGRASVYDLRFSTVEITEENWDAASQVDGEPAPRTAGKSETCVVSGLVGETTYFFVLKVGDEVPNWSGLSNVATGVTQPAPDTVPPDAVTTLEVSSVTSTTATLTWTAVGDDGNTGTAASYDLRYATSPIDPASFASAMPAMGELSPKISGTLESMTVGGLSAGTTYYFALRVADEVSNWSDLSNVPMRATQPVLDTVPPAAVVTLVVASATQTATTLAWAATGDDGNVGTATTYDVRYSVANISRGNFDSASQAEGEPTPSAAGQVQTFVIGGLDPGTRYYFAMKVADEVGNWSGLSKVVNVRTPSTIEVPSPAAITELWITDVGVGTTQLALRHPGTVALGAPVDHYQARVAEVPLDEETWDSSVLVSAPDPGPVGTEVEWLIAGLEPAHTYYLAMRVYDIDGRASGLSPVIQIQTEGGDLAPPDPPGQPSASWNADGTRLTLEWSPAVDSRVTGYALYAQGPDGVWFRYRSEVLPTPSCELDRPDPAIVRLLAVKSVTASGVESALSDPADLYPEAWEIEGPFPHPVTDACTVRISVPVGFPADGVLRVEILSIEGASEAVLHDGPVRAASVVECHWDRRIVGGKAAPPGYHYLLCTGGGYRTLRTIYVAP